MSDTFWCIIELMHGYDYSAFFTETISPLERLTIIQKGVEYVLAEKARKDNFMGFTLRCKKAFDVCIGHDAITAHDVKFFNYDNLVLQYERECSLAMMDRL